ncbi:MAG: hypothetical protein DRQ51_03205 [Gammaproteobacteria bacterium]|nr:MAG: hypothetical protein DRQ51_03205 [Gammaproteobacteria bacterium]
MSKLDTQQLNNLFPAIISASRSTDIPAFYSDWFVNRWRAGFIKWKNNFSGKLYKINFDKTRVVVFWTKNPKPMFKHLDFLDKNIPNYYFQFTLNDYVDEKFELSVANVEKRIKIFKTLSKKLGKKRVIWRFDPLILTDKIDVNKLLRKVENIGNELKDYTTKLVFSFADISIYKRVEYNLKKDDVKYIEFTDSTMHEFASGLQKLNNNWGFEIATCTEKIALEQYGIKHNKCIDDDLMIDIFKEDKQLMKYLGAELDMFTNKITKTKNMKDKGQRKNCGCIIAKDIGQYHTCPHGCNYCYANSSKEYAKINFKLHKQNPNSSTITGDIDARV